jgi:hypothetical protein
MGKRLSSTKAAALSAGSVIFSVLPFMTYASAAPMDCPLERAHYVIRDERDMTAGFVIRRADTAATPMLFFFVHSTSSNTTAWFIPYRSSATARLASTTDIDASGWRPDNPHPLGDLDYGATDDEGHSLENFRFHQGAAAPAVILIPGLQDVLHYGFRSDSQEGLSLAFLDLIACDPG